MSDRSSISPPDRVVRVFVSSTFRDMGEEREELVKRIFPQLRRLCADRGVIWSEVDLRWGITDEQQAEGKVLPICLAEIQRSRPYFIAMLGERYGWVPTEIDDSLVAAEPWLAEHRTRSITELEILHGVLNDPEMATHTFFYLRDPSSVRSRPKREQAALLEGPSEAEIEQLGREEAERRADQRRERLRALKARIRESGLPVRDFRDPRSLEDHVLTDLSGVIDRLFPAGSEPDPLDEEAADHEQFARSRAAVYVARPEAFRHLDAHASGDGPPLVVLGESGGGKSALVANWALRWRERNPDDFVLFHFVGASPGSTDWSSMVRRLVAEIDRYLGREEDIPDEASALRAAFVDRLHRVGARGRAVLIIDALNQLEDRDGAPDLVWLPETPPPNVRLLVSTLPGRPLAEIERRGWPTTEVAPLDADERRTLTVEYLRQYTKELSPDQLERVVQAPQTANPLFLQSMLEELRLWGHHETLGTHIDHYLEAATPEELYGKVLHRYEEDYERDRPGLVRDAMSLLWGGRRGLSEAELLDILGTGDAPLPRAHWSPLYLAAERSLIDRAGLIGFSHDYLRQAVEARYLPRAKDRQRIHVRIADYFDGRRDTPRGMDELPWQLVEASAWRRLYDLLSDVAFLVLAWRRSRSDVKASWARLESSSKLRLVDAYAPVIRRGADASATESLVADLLGDMGHPHEAYAIRERLVDLDRASGNASTLQSSLGNQALILADWGRMEEALELFREQERMCRELGYDEHLAFCLGNQAQILRFQGQLEQALTLLEEQERISRARGDPDALQGALWIRALILYDLWRLDEALSVLEEQERICREHGNQEGLERALGARGGVLAALERPEEALALHQEEERICRELGASGDLQASLGSQARILWGMGRPEEAMPLLKEQERICREQGFLPGLQHCLSNQGSILREQGRHSEAIAIHQEEERICRELGHPSALALALANQAWACVLSGRREDALRLADESEQVAATLEARDWAEQLKPVIAYVRDNA